MSGLAFSVAPSIMGRRRWLWGGSGGDDDRVMLMAVV